MLGKNESEGKRESGGEIMKTGDILSMTWLKMSSRMQHFLSSHLELVPENRGPQSSRIVCGATGGEARINIQTSSKLISKSVLAVFMSMNERVSAVETARADHREGRTDED